MARPAGCCAGRRPGACVLLLLLLLLLRWHHIGSLLLVLRCAASGLPGLARTRAARSRGSSGSRVVDACCRVPSRVGAGAWQRQPLCSAGGGAREHSRWFRAPLAVAITSTRRRFAGWMMAVQLPAGASSPVVASMLTTRGLPSCAAVAAAAAAFCCWLCCCCCCSSCCCWLCWCCWWL